MLWARVSCAKALTNMALDSVVTLRLDGNEVAGEIHSPITPAILAEVDQFWTPLLAQHKQQDVDWRWDHFLKECPDGEAYKSFALVCQGRAEGLLIVAKERQMRSELVVGSYMEYLASAPWNRQALSGGALVSDRGRVTPCGQVLVARAALLSIEQGHHGWLGWNSLPGDTLAWYRNLVPGAKSDFATIPEDEHYQYIEMPPLCATALLGKPPIIARK